ncbi:MAG: thermonuclease family protein [Gammaproteobacteria bacterium]|nr:thermonuclease family protein [Gammaproteobacteria bacterium]
MRWAFWILAATVAFAVMTWLYPGTSQRPSAPPDSPTFDATGLKTDLSGRAQVIDGDSVYVGGVEVRLYGVDAPEARQTCATDGVRWPCGRQATRALRQLIEGRVLACAERDRDNYGRVVAVCRLEGADVNAWLVENGWAIAYRRHARAYVGAESVAQAAKRGIWRGDFVAPWDWRQAEARSVAANNRPQRRASGVPQTSTPAEQRGRCNIKGNISYNSGRRL